MGDIVVIDKPRNRIVVTPSHHAGRRFLRCEFLGVCRLVFGTWGIAANHFLVFAERDTLALQSLNIFQARENLMLNDEDGLHLILAPFLDGKGLAFQ